MEFRKKTMKKSMKLRHKLMKKGLASILVLILALSLCACGNSKPDPDVNNQSVVNSTVSDDTNKDTNNTDSNNTNNNTNNADSNTNTNNTDNSVSEKYPNNEEPWITEIDHCVMNPGQRNYITDEIIEAYADAMDGIFAHETEVRLSDSWDDNLMVLGLLQQNPYTFVASEYDLTDDHKSMYFEYKYSKEECDEMFAFMDDEYLTILNEIIDPEMNDLEKVLAVHKYFAERIEYDYDWVAKMKLSTDDFTYPDIVVYEALKTGKGVCHTYTYLCEFALQQMDIDCIRVCADVRDSDDAHMWLLVWLDGEPYHVDPTWDSNGGMASLQYFGLTNQENYDRGMDDGWACIDISLNTECVADTFTSWRDIWAYQLIGNHQMKVWREDGTEEVLEL